MPASRRRPLLLSKRGVGLWRRAGEAPSMTRQAWRYPEKRPAIWGGVVFLMAFAIRAAFIFESNHIASIRTPTPGMDVDLYWQAARLIGRGLCRDQPCFELMMCSSPLFPCWVAFWQMVLGPDMLLHRLLNALLASVSAVLMFRLMFRLTNRLTAALFGSLAWAVLPSLIFFDATLYKASLAILLLSMVFTLVLSEPESIRIYPYIIKGALTGMLLGLLLLQQSATFLFFMVVMAYCVLDKRLGPGKKLALLGALAGCLIMTGFGFHLHNTWRGDRHNQPIPQKGVHFRIGFNERADGTYVRLAQIPAWPYGHSFASRMVAETALARPLTPAQADRYFIKQALKYMTDHPMAAIGLIIKKTILFFNDYEVKGVDDLYYLKRQSRILSLSPFGLGVIVVFAALGVVSLLESRQLRLLLLLGGMLGAVLASNLIIFVSWRYRLLNLVPLFLLASFGIVFVKEKTLKLIHGPDPLGKRLFRFFGTAMLPMIGAGLLTYSPAIGEKDGAFYRQAEVNAQLSLDAEKLLKELHRRERQASTHPKALARRALLLVQLHRHSEAYILLKSICRQSLDNPTAVHHYLTYLFWLGEYDEAVELIKTVNRRNARLVPIIVNDLKGVEKQVYELFVRERAHDMMSLTGVQRS